MLLAKNLRRVEQLLREVNNEYGYEEVLVSCVGDAMVYEGTSKPAVRFLCDSRLLALRSDFTLTLIPFLVDKNQSTFLPVRASYFGKVFWAAKEVIETYQAGVECFSEDFPAADREVLQLARDYIQVLKQSESVICVGLAPIADEVANYCKLTPPQRASLKQMLQRKDYVALERLLRQHLAPPRFQAIWSLFTTRDNQEALYLLEKYFPRLFQLTGLSEITTLLGDDVVLDMGLLRRLDYYCGIIFEAYCRELPYPILSGGRYEITYQPYRSPVSAVGFALNLDHLLKGL